MRSALCRTWPRHRQVRATIRRAAAATTAFGRPDGASLVFRCLNADKQSVVLDNETDADRRYLTELLATSDVLVTDWDASTVLAGADVAALQHAHPGLVVVSLTTFGLMPDPPTDGGDSLLAEAFGGLATLIGSPARRPLALGGDQSAYLAAFAGFLGASTALIARDHSGRGDLVDVAQCDVAALADWKSDITFAVDGRVPRRPGVRGDSWRVVPARDGWVGVIFQPHQWTAVKQLVDDRRLDDSRLDTAAGRTQHAELWWPVVEAWVACAIEACRVRASAGRRAPVRVRGRPRRGRELAAVRGAWVHRHSRRLTGRAAGAVGRAAVAHGSGARTRCAPSGARTSGACTANARPQDAHRWPASSCSTSARSPPARRRRASSPTTELPSSRSNRPATLTRSAPGTRPGRAPRASTSRTRCSSRTTPANSA